MVTSHSDAAEAALGPHQLCSPDVTCQLCTCFPGIVTHSEEFILCGPFFFPCFFVAEIGDFDEALDREHLAKNKYVPQQDALEDKIVEFHHSHM